MAGLLCLCLVFSVLPGLGVSAKQEEKLIAFTFDDGPGPYTDKLLDALNQRGAKATFFMLGQNVDNYPDAVKKAVETGHEIASHSWDHPNFNGGMSSDSIYSQIGDTNAVLKKYDGKDYHLLRCPYGESNDTVKGAVNSQIIYWSVDTSDWRSHDSSAVHQEAISNAYDGAIVLAHDIYETSVDGMIQAVDTLQAEGYTFVTVSELMERRGTNLANGETLFDARFDPDAEPVEEPIGTAYTKGLSFLKSSGDEDGNTSAICTAGTSLQVLNDDGEQTKVITPWGVKGYVSSSDIVRTDDTKAARPKEPEATTQPTAVQEPQQPLNREMRTKCGTELKSATDGGSVLCLLPNRSNVVLLENTDDSYSMVKTAGGLVGYVRNDYLKDAYMGAGRHKGREDKNKGDSIEFTAPQSGVATGTLSLRATPDVNAAISAVVEEGTELTVIEQDAGNWCKVKTAQGQEGYVRSYCVGSGPLQTGKTTDEVNFRSSPDTSKDPMGLLGSSAKLRILDSSQKGWYIVLTQDMRIGYVSSDFVKLDSDNSESPA